MFTILNNSWRSIRIRFHFFGYSPAFKYYLLYVAKNKKKIEKKRDREMEKKKEKGTHLHFRYFFGSNDIFRI